MNYAELRAKATKGRIHAYRGSGFNGLKDDSGVCLSITQDEKPELRDGAAFTALLAHCYNHFDEVVEALESLYDYAHKHTPLREFEGGAPSLLMKTLAVLARAKEIK